MLKPLAMIVGKEIKEVLLKEKELQDGYSVIINPWFTKPYFKINLTVLLDKEAIEYYNNLLPEEAAMCGKIEIIP